MTATDEPSEHVNKVHLVGRVSAPPSSRAMPSGDRAVLWRLVVRRVDARKRPGDRDRAGPVVDTIDCVAWAPGVQRRAERWDSGDVVECEGALRRRFWRTPAGPASRYEVEVVRGHRVRGRAR